MFFSFRVRICPTGCPVDLPSAASERKGRRGIRRIVDDLPPRQPFPKSRKWFWRLLIQRPRRNLTASFWRILRFYWGSSFRWSYYLINIKLLQPPNERLVPYYGRTVKMVLLCHQKDELQNASISILQLIRKICPRIFERKGGRRGVTPSVRTAE